MKTKPRFPLSRNKNHELGVVFAWIGVAFLMLFSFSLVMIEGSRVVIVEEQLKQAVSNAALAAALELNGRKSGWRSAKRAAASAFYSQRIEGAPKIPVNPDVIFNLEGDNDTLESDLKYQQKATQVGGIKLTIERGVYWSNEEGKMIFRSLEGQQDKEIVDSVGDLVRLKSGLPVFAIANAVRITATAASVGSIITNGTLINVPEQSSLAVSDDDFEECVLPIAIPACELMLDTNINSNWSYSTDEYKADLQCEREVLATEADPLSGDNFIYRVQGLMRSELYPAFPKLKDSAGNYAGPNRKVVPVKAVLGVGDLQAGNSSIASNSEVLKVLQSENGCQNVRIGSRFKPIENGVRGGGLLTSEGSSLGNQLRYLFDLAKNNGLTFQKAFTVNNSNPLLTSDSKILTENYPYLNYQIGSSDSSNELIKDYRLSGGRTLRVKLGQPSNKHNFSNPMCYDFARAPNDPLKGVIQGKVMLIAPDRENLQTGASNYCDFTARFGGSIGNITPPVASTNPRIVGFADANLFDFNVVSNRDDVINSFNDTIDISPAGYSIIPTSQVGINSALINDNVLTPEEISNSATQFIDASKEYWQCMAVPKCSRLQRRTGDTDNCRTSDCGRPPIPSFKDSFDVLVSELGSCIAPIDEPLWNDCKNVGDSINTLLNQKETIDSFNNKDASDINDISGLSDSIDEVFKGINLGSNNPLVKNRLDKLQELTEQVAQLKEEIENLPQQGDSADSSDSSVDSADVDSTDADSADVDSADVDSTDADSTNDKSSNDKGPSLKEKLEETLDDAEKDLKYTLNDLLDRLRDNTNLADLTNNISQLRDTFNTKCDAFKQSSRNLGEVTTPNRYCLPTRRPTCINTQADGCYSAIEPKEKQHGCGGVRLRLSCQEQPRLGVTNVYPNPQLTE